MSEAWMSFNLNRESNDTSFKPNINGVWKFEGYETTDCHELKSCHINRVFFKHIPGDLNVSREVYKMG